MKTCTVRTLAAFCFLAASGFGECGNNNVVSLIGSGFTLISPASNLFTPGAVVLMTKDEQGRAALKLLCGPRGSLGPNFSPRISETMSGTYKMSKTQRFELESDAVERFKARTKVEDVRSVSVAFSNPRVLEVEEQEVIAGVDFRSPECQRAIDARMEAGFRPTFVTSAFAADIEYTVSFNREHTLTKRVMEDRMGRIAANLGGGHTEISSHSLRAVNLIVAVRADEFLLTIKPDGKRGPPPAWPRRGLDAPFAEALPGSESPLVPPPNAGWVSPVRGP